MMNRRQFSTLLLLLAAGACDGGDPVGPDSLAVTITAPASVRHGEQITFTMTVRNTAGRDATFTTYAAEPDDSFAPVVVDDTGLTLWSGVDLLAPGPGELRLRPGEERVYTKTWDLRRSSGELLAPGSYRVRGRLLGFGGAVLVQTAELPTFEVLE